MRKSVRNGVLIGSLTGIVTGLKWIKSEADDHPLGLDFALYASIPLGIVGAGVGAVIGTIPNASVTIKIPIFGNFGKFKKNRRTLKEYSYIH